MNAGRPSQAHARFADSVQHGADCELWLVEGDSAARSVINVRDERTQAVLPLQGKPLNAWRASARKVGENVLYRQVSEALGSEQPASAAARFERVLLLLDPDADGVHIEALMLLYFARWQPAWIEAGRLWRVRAPMFTLTHTGTGETAHAYSPAHRDALLARLREQAAGKIALHKHVGLGSLPPALLRRCCIDPATRAARQVNAEDLAAVRQALGLDAAP